jgi:hypothetical protein
MTPAAMRYAPAILDHLTEHRELASLPLTVRGVWLYLVLAMVDRPHTVHGLTADTGRLAEMVVCRQGDMDAAFGILIELGLLERSPADGYLRSPFLMRLIRPAGRR